MKVLLIEDDAGISRPVEEGLTREGHEVTLAATCEAARGAFAGSDPEIVLLDLRLPDGDGLDLAREFRERSRVPIIITTARGEEVDVVVGLEVGADDYLVKPFGIRELIARIRAVARRAGDDDEAPAELAAGALRIEPGARRAWLGETPLDLTPREFDLLAHLARHVDRVLERDAIFRAVWGGEWFGSGKTLDVHIGSLRRKLGDAGWIETHRGIGFALRPRT